MVMLESCQMVPGMCRKVSDSFRKVLFLGLECKLQQRLLYMEVSKMITAGVMLEETGVVIHKQDN